ncbi:MAG: peptidylprolyl isomerase [Lentisphaeria bacterium]|nr:peptidylprolyl isomerase [Lentisphaeria bacterium]
MKKLTMRALLLLLATIAFVSGQSITIDDDVPLPPPLAPIEDIGAPTSQTPSLQKLLEFLPEVLVTYDGGTRLTRIQVMEELGVGLNFALQQGRRFSEDDLRQIVRRSVQSTLGRTVLLDVAGRHGFKPDVGLARDKLAEQGSNELLGAMHPYGVSEEKVIMRISEQLAIDHWVDARVRGQLRVEIREVQNFYEQNKAHFKQPEQRHISHIMLAIDPGASPEAADERRSQLKTTREHVSAGADFAEVARQISECPVSRSKGGDLGLITSGTMNAAFERAAFALQPGVVSDVVVTEIGLHLIKVHEVKGGGPIELEGVREQVEELIMNQKVNIAVQKIVELELQARNVEYLF